VGKKYLEAMMAGEAEVTKWISPETKQKATERAKDQAQAEMWSVEIAIFFFGVLVTIIILLLQEIVIEIAASVAVFSLSMGWFAGWRQGRRLYQYYYRKELDRFVYKKREGKEQIEETTEDMIRKTLRAKWQ